MEHLLALSIDNLSSPQPAKIRKGLRQVEGLLAQICFSASKQPPPSPSKHQSSAFPTEESQRSSFEQLTSDSAFLEFFRLQQTFEYNLATRLVSSLSLLKTSRNHTSQPDQHQIDLLTSTLTLLQGILLLHPPSRSLFSRHTNLSLLLDLLQLPQQPQILSTTLLTLLTALLDNPSNARAFEEADGLRAVIALRTNEHDDVRFAAQDVLAYWLMPEIPEVSSDSGSRAPSAERRRAEGAGVERREMDTRTTSCASDAAVGGGVALPVTPSRRRDILAASGVETPTRPTAPMPAKTPSRSCTAQTPLSYAQQQRSPYKMSAAQTGNGQSTRTSRSDGSGRSWGSLRSEGEMVRSVNEKKMMLRDVMRVAAEAAVQAEMF